MSVAGLIEWMSDVGFELTIEADDKADERGGCEEIVMFVATHRQAGERFAVRAPLSAAIAAVEELAAVIEERALDSDDVEEAWPHGRTSSGT